MNDKNVNPLGTFPKMADQSAAGTDFNYVYSYESEGNTVNMDLTFALYKGAGYSYTGLNGANTTPKYLFISDGNADKGKCCIKLPAVPGRYLKSVSCSHTGTTYSRNFRLQEGYPTAGHYFTASATPSAADAIATATINIPTGTTNTAQINTTEKGCAYYIQFNSAAKYSITNITVVYTKAQPSAE